MFSCSLICVCQWNIARVMSLNFTQFLSYRSTLAWSLGTLLKMAVSCALGVGFSSLSISCISKVVPTSSWFPCFTRRWEFSAVVVNLLFLSTQTMLTPHLLQFEQFSSTPGTVKIFQQGVLVFARLERVLLGFDFFTIRWSQNSTPSSPMRICSFDPLCKQLRWTKYWVFAYVPALLGLQNYTASEPLGYISTNYLVHWRREANSAGE